MATDSVPNSVPPESAGLFMGTELMVKVTPTHCEVSKPRRTPLRVDNSES